MFDKYDSLRKHASVHKLDQGYFLKHVSDANEKLQRDSLGPFLLRHAKGTNKKTKGAPKCPSKRSSKISYK